MEKQNGCRFFQTAALQMLRMPGRLGFWIKMAKGKDLSEDSLFLDTFSDRDAHILGQYVRKTDELLVLRMLSKNSLTATPSSGILHHGLRR